MILIPCYAHEKTPFPNKKELNNKKIYAHFLIITWLINTWPFGQGIYVLK